MNPTIEIFKLSFFIFFCFILLVVKAIIDIAKTKLRLKWKIFILVLAALVPLAPFFIPPATEKLYEYYQIPYIKNKLDGASLQMLANESRGLLFVRSQVIYLDQSRVVSLGLSEDAIRYLISLSLVRSEIFPTSLNYSYYITALGRYVLINDLRFKLYPISFCEFHRVRSWEAYKDKCDFTRERDAFKRRFGVDWDECWRIFGKVVKQIEPGSGEDYLDTFTRFKKSNEFDTVMEKIVKPWQDEVTKAYPEVKKEFNE